MAPKCQQFRTCSRPKDYIQAIKLTSFYARASSDVTSVHIYTSVLRAVLLRNRSSLTILTFCMVTSMLRMQPICAYYTVIDLIIVLVKWHRGSWAFCLKSRDSWQLSKVQGRDQSPGTWPTSRKNRSNLTICSSALIRIDGCEAGSIFKLGALYVFFVMSGVLILRAYLL